MFMRMGAYHVFDDREENLSGYDLGELDRWFEIFEGKMFWYVAF